LSEIITKYTYKSSADSLIDLFISSITLATLLILLFCELNAEGANVLIDGSFVLIDLILD